jgi:hypothetical protein
MNLLVVIGGCHVKIIFLFGQKICLLIQGCIELRDFLFVEFDLSFKFLVIFSQELYIVLLVSLLNCLVIKEIVQFPDLVFKGSRFLIRLLTNLFVFSNLLKKTFSLFLDAFYLSFQSRNILVEHLDLFG